MSQNFEQTYLQLRRAVLEKHFSRMNDKQREAVFQTEGPVLILAGAGSGKTTVVVNRIANMVQFGNAYHSDYVPAWVGEEDLAFLQDWLDDKLDDGDITRERLTRIVADRPVRPWNILAITFTNKAAGELKERLEAMLGEQALDIQASTFHSACMRILRREITALGYERSFTVYDTDDSVRIIKEALKELAIQEKVMAPKGILASISAAKDQLLSPEDVLREANGDYRQEVVGKVYSYYQKRLKAANALDFDDIIIFTVKIFQQYPDVLEKYRNRFRYIMVKPSDVPTYVDHGVADVGIVGKDTLMEENRPLYEMLDLGFGKCRICVCGYAEQEPLKKAHIRVATKYTGIAGQVFATRGSSIEIIKLNGSVELGPVIGLSDVILDIVESGATLRANGLSVIEEICTCSARLVVNRVSLKTKETAIRPFIDGMRREVERRKEQGL